MVEKLNPLVSSVMFMVITWGSKVVLGKIKEYSELSDKHTANLILILSTYIAYRFIYFQGKFPPTRLLEPPRFGRFLSSFKLLFRCFKQLKVASKSFLNYVWMVKLMQFEVFKSQKFDLYIIRDFYVRKNPTYTFISFWRFFLT